MTAVEIRIVILLRKQCHDGLEMTLYKEIAQVISIWKRFNIQQSQGLPDITNSAAKNTVHIASLCTVTEECTELNVIHLTAGNWEHVWKKVEIRIL